MHSTTIYLVCLFTWQVGSTLHWRHNGRDGVSNHQPHDGLLNRLFRRRSKKTSKLRVTGFCEGNSPMTGEFPAQRASYAENISIWWHHHDPMHFENASVMIVASGVVYLLVDTTVWSVSHCNIVRVMPKWLLLLIDWMTEGNGRKGRYIYSHTPCK